MSVSAPRRPAELPGSPTAWPPYARPIAASVSCAAPVLRSCGSARVNARWCGCTC